jgi:hypothetical protein
MYKNIIFEIKMLETDFQCKCRYNINKAEDNNDFQKNCVSR